MWMCHCSCNRALMPKLSALHTHEKSGRWNTTSHRRPSRHSSLRKSSKTVLVCSLPDGRGPSKDNVAQEAQPEQAPSEPKPAPSGRRQADSTDPVASFLTRRFGLAGGLGWLAILAIGSLGEQVKTRMEVAQEEEGTQEVTDAQEVTLPSGVSYIDLRRGGGSSPQKGYLAVIDYTGKANGEVFEDTRARGKPIVVFTGSRPFTGGLCEGVEEAMSSMRAGGRRIIKVPASKGFRSAGTVLKPTNHVPGKSGIIPGDAFLEYDLELLRVSIPPS